MPRVTFRTADSSCSLSAVRGVALGELHLPLEVVRRVFAGIRDAEKGNAVEVAGLTSRELEILVSFARGMSYAQIAQARGVKPVTVRNAIYSIQQKLRIRMMQGLLVRT